jgi:hypothetical protein
MDKAIDSGEWMELLSESPKTKNSRLKVEQEIRRIFLAYSVIVIFSFLAVQSRDPDSFFSGFEDYVIVVLNAISVAVFTVVWLRNDQQAELKKANKIALIAMIVSAPFAIYGISKEFKSLSDLTDEFTSLFGGVFLGAVLKRGEKKRKDKKNKVEKGSTELKVFLGQDLRTLPSWALDSDHLFLSRKLEKAIQKEKTGSTAHKRYSSTYVGNLRKKLNLIESEIKKRRKELAGR